MSDHLSTQLLNRYRQRRLEPGELLALDDHLATCAACRDLLRGDGSLRSPLLALRTSLQEPDRNAVDHLREEQLMAYTTGNLDEVDRELAESHLESCAACAAQSQKLGEAVGKASDLSDKTSATALWTRLIVAGERLLSFTAFRVATAIAVTALLVIAAWLWLRTGTEREERVEQPPAPQPLTPQAQPETPAPIFMALNDGGNQITLDMQGNLKGLESLSPADQQRVRAALTTERVLKPDTLRELADASAPSMGRPDSAAFALLYPVGRIIESDRPTFRWRPLDGAISYQVTITDPKDGYKEIATSPELRDTKWRVDNRLKRGRIYNWQVTARTNDGEEKAPAADAPEAKFKALELTKLDEIVRAKKDYAGRHLTLGLIYAQAGLIDEAEREFEWLVRDNPQSAIAKNLLRDLQARPRRR